MKSLRAASFFCAISLLAAAGLSLSACGGGPSTATGGGGSGGDAGSGGNAGSAGNGGDAGNGGTAGNGGSAGSGGSGGQSSNGAKYAEALCGNLFKCCPEADLPEVFGGGLPGGSIVDYAGCRIVYRTLWDAAIDPVLAKSEAAGRVTFDEAAFAACMKTIAERPCGDVSSINMLCADVFVPKVMSGGTCAANLECTTGKCDVPDGAAEGKCVDQPPPAKLGEACTFNDDCDKMLYCEASKCAPAKPDGQACSSDGECQSDACTGNQQGMGQCATICKGGGPGPGPIDDVLESIGGPLAEATCGQTFKCCSAEERSAALLGGGSNEAECLGLYGVFGGLGFVQTHNSVVDGKVSLDGAKMKACIADLAAASCSAFPQGVELDCPDAIKGLVADGKACSNDNECVSEYCKDVMNGQGTCAPLPTAGAACKGDCAEGLYCNAQICTAQKALGDMCTSDAQCGQGSCFGPSGGPETCTIICDGK